MAIKTDPLWSVISHPDTGEIVCEIKLLVCAKCFGAFDHEFFFDDRDDWAEQIVTDDECEWTHDLRIGDWLERVVYGVARIKTGPFYTIDAISREILYNNPCTCQKGTHNA